MSAQKQPDTRQQQPDMLKKPGEKRQARPAPFKRRDILILMTIWLVGCLLVAGLVALFYLNKRGVTPDQPQPATTFVIPVKGGNTAKAAYQLALKQAQQWHEDVELVAMSAQWPAATVENLGQGGAWDCRFFSASSQRLYFVVVTPDNQALGQAHLFQLKHSAPGLINRAEWVIDSHEALTTWVNNGGGLFLKKFPGSRVEALLRQAPNPPKPVWDIIGANADQSQIFYLAIDAANGQIVP
jgi:hypothetical protein